MSVDGVGTGRAGQLSGESPPVRRLRRRWASSWLPISLVAAVFALYAPLPGRGFTSEDFLLLRVLRERPPWGDLWGLFTEPWLGVEVVRFYRPVGELLLALEAQLFAGHPVGYNLVHTALHAVNALLVWRLCRYCLGLGADADADGGASGAASRRVAWVAGLLFAVHPLAPNAVSWIASYATLFATTLVLATWWAWEGLVRHPRDVRRWVALAGLYLAALGCYEAAVVLPAALALRGVLLMVGNKGVGSVEGVGDAEGGEGRRLGWLPPTALTAGLAAAYLLVRWAALGATVGGYASFAERLTSGGPGPLAADALISLRRLVYPVYGAGGSAAFGWAVLAVAFLLPAVLALRARAGGPSRVGGLGLLVFGWAWAVLFLAPFAFQPFVPANGRYAYLATVGLVLVLAPVAGWVSPPRESGDSPWRVVLPTLAGLLLAALAVLWVFLAVAHVGDLKRAGELAARVSSELRVAAAGQGRGVAVPGMATSRPLLVAGYPLFLTDGDGTPRAQVLRYGLSDSLGEPFVTAEEVSDGASRRLVYPLPEGVDISARAAFRAAGVAVKALTWEAEPVAFRPTEAVLPPVGEITAVLQPQTAAGPSAAQRVASRPFPGATRHRLVVLSRGNPTLVELAPAVGASPTGDGARVEAAAPQAFIRSMRQLYSGPVHGGPIWWWVEGRDETGELLAVSPAKVWP